MLTELLTTGDDSSPVVESDNFLSKHLEGLADPNPLFCVYRRLLNKSIRISSLNCLLNQKFFFSSWKTYLEVKCA